MWIPSKEQVKWLIVILSLGALFAGGWYLGATLKQGEWDAAVVQQVEDLNRQIAEANAKVAAQEKQMAVNQAKVSAKYQKQLQEKEREKADAIASAESRGLWVNTTACQSTASVSDSTAPTTGHNGGEKARLPEKTSRDLISLLNEADKVVEQLTACQAILNDKQPQD